MELGRQSARGARADRLCQPDHHLFRPYGSGCRWLNAMRTLVLRVVAEPPQVFWAPLLPAAGNVLINITAMLFGIMGFNVKLVEFFDDECPFCKKLSPDIEKLVSE